VGEFARAARQHWGIQNGLHWVLGVVYREDECRIPKRNGPANFAAIRHMTLNPFSAPKPRRKRASASNEASPLSTRLSSKPS